MPETPKDWYDERLLCADPRDVAHDAERALWVVVELLGESGHAVDRRGMEALLRVIQDKLHPAVRTLEHYRAPE